MVGTLLTALLSRLKDKSLIHQFLIRELLTLPSASMTANPYCITKPGRLRNPPENKAKASLMHEIKELAEGSCQPLSV